MKKTISTKYEFDLNLYIAEQTLLNLEERYSLPNDIKKKVHDLYLYITNKLYKNDYPNMDIVNEKCFLITYYEEDN